jgi:two-component system KDP operon response regulator KdpE
MTTAGPLVLIVEDEPGLRRFLRVTLVNTGFRILEAARGAEALDLAAAHVPDLLLLDLGLPDMDGMEVLQELRRWSAAPVIILTARGTEGDKVRALDAGADDYLTKPFSAQELLARLRVALRHASRRQGPDEPVLQTGGLRVDLARRRVTVEDQEVHLTPIEFTLLATLAKHAGRVLTHRQLLNAAWGPDYGGEAHYLRVYMVQLRRKIERDPANPRYLRTETGVGYRLATEP